MTTRKTRVLLVIGSLHFGGAERVIAHLATGLDKSRFEVAVYCTRAVGKVGEEIRSQGVSVTQGSLGSRWTRIASTPLQLLRAIREFRADVVHTHGVVALSAAGPLAFLKLLPRWIHTFHFGNYPYKNRRQMWLERILCSQASRLVAVANAQRDAVIRYNRLRPDRVGAIFNGVKENPYVDNPAVRTEKRAELGFGPDTFIVGTIAVLSEQKGIPYFLSAAKASLKLHPQIRFLVVGGGPLEAQLRALASELGIADKVTFTGWRADVPQLLPTLDVFVMSSLWEAMPLALLEAMAAGRPIVVTDVGDNATLVRNEQSALLVPPKSHEALATAIGRLISDPGLRARIAQAALDEYRSKFTVGHMIREHEYMYAAEARSNASYVTDSYERT